MKDFKYYSDLFIESETFESKSDSAQGLFGYMNGINLDLQLDPFRFHYSELDIDDESE